MHRGASSAVTEDQAPVAGTTPLVASMAQSADLAWFHNTGDQPTYVLLNASTASGSLYDLIVPAGESYELSLGGRIGLTSFSAYWASGSLGYKARYWAQTDVTL